MSLPTGRLQLSYLTGISAEVETVDFAGMHEIRATIGEVFKNDNGLWSARDSKRHNHGDSYNTMWDAARQLALGLGKGKYV